jgi:hypothetical protein
VLKGLARAPPRQRGWIIIAEAKDAAERPAAKNCHNPSAEAFIRRLRISLMFKGLTDVGKAYGKCRDKLLRKSAIIL